MSVFLVHQAQANGAGADDSDGFIKELHFFE
jgi:hypothetical protein